MNNDKIKLIAAIMHLNKASTLIKSFNNDLSIGILEVIDAIINTYKISNDQINDLENLKQEIISHDA